MNKGNSGNEPPQGFDRVLEKEGTDNSERDGAQINNPQPNSRSEMRPSGRTVYFCPVCKKTFLENPSDKSETVAKKEAAHHLYAEHFDEIANEFASVECCNSE